MKRRMRVNEFEIQSLKERAESLGVDIETYIDALHSNYVHEIIAEHLESVKG